MRRRKTCGQCILVMVFMRREHVSRPDLILLLSLPALLDERIPGLELASMPIVAARKRICPKEYPCCGFVVGSMRRLFWLRPSV